MFKRYFFDGLEGLDHRPVVGLAPVRCRVPASQGTEVRPAKRRIGADAFERADSLHQLALLGQQVAERQPPRAARIGHVDPPPEPLLQFLGLVQRDEQLVLEPFPARLVGLGLGGVFEPLHHANGQLRPGVFPSRQAHQRDQAAMVEDLLKLRSVRTRSVSQQSPALAGRAVEVPAGKHVKVRCFDAHPAGQLRRRLAGDVAEPVGKPLAGQPQGLGTLVAQLRPGELFRVLDRLHAGRQSGLDHVVRHLVGRRDGGHQPGQRIFGVAEPLDERKCLRLIRLRPRLRQQGVKELPGITGPVFVRRIGKPSPQEGEALGLGEMAKEDAPEALAEPMLDLVLGLGVPAAA